jgi:hypothetical protein
VRVVTVVVAAPVEMVRSDLLAQPVRPHRDGLLAVPAITRLEELIRHQTPNQERQQKVDMGATEQQAETDRQNRLPTTQIFQWCLGAGKLPLPVLNDEKVIFARNDVNNLLAEEELLPIVVQGRTTNYRDVKVITGYNIFWIWDQGQKS